MYWSGMYMIGLYICVYILWYYLFIHIPYRYENDWQSAYGAFIIGISIFPVLLASVGWAVFWGNAKFVRNVSAGIVTVFGIILLIAWGRIGSSYSFLKVTSKRSSIFRFIHEKDNEEEEEFGNG